MRLGHPSTLIRRAHRFEYALESGSKQKSTTIVLARTRDDAISVTPKTDKFENALVWTTPKFHWNNILYLTNAQKLSFMVFIIHGYNSLIDVSYYKKIIAIYIGFNYKFIPFVVSFHLHYFLFASSSFVVSAPVALCIFPSIHSHYRLTIRLRRYC